MGVGQHYNMAAYIGEKFVLEKDDIGERARDNLLNVLVVKKFLEIEKNELSREEIKKEIEKCVVKMPAKDVLRVISFVPKKKKS